VCAAIQHEEDDLALSDRSDSMRAASSAMLFGSVPVGPPAPHLAGSPLASSPLSPIAVSEQGLSHRLSMTSVEHSVDVSELDASETMSESEPT
jgi:hypothetical protein